MIWNPNKECMSRDEMSALQGKRLHRIVEYVYHNVPFYRNKLQELDIRPLPAPRVTPPLWAIPARTSVCGVSVWLAV